MASAVKVGDTGDADEEDKTVESDVPHNFRCAICFNVLKQPMQCPRNEHSFCRPCILRYLEEFQRCPSCMEPLTIQTLRPSRVITDLMSQLKIKCGNVSRGCPDIMKLENLEAHVLGCEFSPVKCSNEGCDVVIDRQYQADHENNECIFRQGKCEVCGEDVLYGKRKFHCYVTKTEMGEVREEISSMKEMMTKMSSELTCKMGQMKDQMNAVTQEMGGITVEIAEMKCEIDKIKKEVQNKKQESQRPTRSLGPPVHCLEHNVNIRNDVIVAGGDVEKSVEMFCWSTRRWTYLSPMMSECYLSSSFVYGDQMFVCGGARGGGNKVEILSLKEEDDGEWARFPATLPKNICGHTSIVYEDNLFIFGGERGDEVVNDIYKVGLVSVYSSQLVCDLPEPRSNHGSQRFGDKVAVVGGTTTGHSSDSLDSVVLYDITLNCCRTLAPLPFPVCEMATVALGDNIIIIGGLDKYDNVLNSVVSYNVKEQKSKMLPPMKQDRQGCTAVVTNNVIIVMGGHNRENGYLNSVECFNCSTYVWEDLPSMGEERWGATAVVKC